MQVGLEVGRSPIGWPLLLLFAAATAAPAAILGQGGCGHSAALGFCAVLAAPPAALEMMYGLARALLRLEAGSA